jgi:hypothetical protein
MISLHSSSNIALYNFIPVFIHQPVQTIFPSPTSAQVLSPIPGFCKRINPAPFPKATFKRKGGSIYGKPAKGTKAKKESGSAAKSAAAIW